MRTILSFAALAAVGVVLAGCPDEKKDAPAASSTAAAASASAAATPKAAGTGDNKGSGW